MREIYPEYSIVKVVRPVTDLSLGAPVGKVLDDIPVGAIGTIVHRFDEPHLPVGYMVEFHDLPGNDGTPGRVETVLHDELALAGA
jgi:hypothetical protein